MGIKLICRGLGILGVSVFCWAGIAMGAENSSSSEPQATATPQSAHARHSSLKAPEITVVQLFSDVLIDVDDFEGWKVRGTGLGELSVWTRQGDQNNRKKLLVQAQSDESQGKKIPLHPVTADPVKLTQETRELFEGIHDDTVRWDGSFAGYEYIFDPMMTLHTEGNPISIYLVREIPHGGNGSERMASLGEISQAYIAKGAEFKSRGLPEVAQRFLKKGIRITEKLAEAGNPEAQFVVGQAMEKGEECPQDFVKAAEWYEKAARSGNSQAHEALKRRGFRKFVQIWKNAHDEHFSHLAEAERALVKIYLHGNDWIAQDFQLASQWLKKHWSDSLKAAQEGDMQIQFGLGVMYADGFEVPRDEAQAKNWLKKAVEQGHRAAHDFLDDMNNPEKRMNQKLAEFGIHVVALPGGRFTMGTPDTAEERRRGRVDSETEHLVELSPFFVMDTKLTREQWNKITGEDPGSHEITNWRECLTCPMTHVNWDDAQKVIQKLEKKGIRAKLPTEAQQEYYMRLSYDEKKITQTTYPWGTDLTQLRKYAWYFENSGGHVHPVGTTEIPVNSYGMKDVLGNVLEWSDSWYGSYSRNSRRRDGTLIPIQDPQGPNYGVIRVIRGGDWGTGAQDCRPAGRVGWVWPVLRSENLGFRLVILP